jgi:hypothetical protein
VNIGLQHVKMPAVVILRPGTVRSKLCARFTETLPDDFEQEHPSGNGGIE